MHPLTEWQGAVSRSEKPWQVWLAQLDPWYDSQGGACLCVYTGDQKYLSFYDNLIVLRKVAEVLSIIEVAFSSLFVVSGSEYQLLQQGVLKIKDIRHADLSSEAAGHA